VLFRSNECVEIYDGKCVLYTGPAISCFGIVSGMNLNTIIFNMANALCECGSEPINVFKPFYAIPLNDLCFLENTTTTLMYHTGANDLPELNDFVFYTNNINNPVSNYQGGASLIEGDTPTLAFLTNGVGQSIEFICVR
jgi:hypothetical protein